MVLFLCLFIWNNMWIWISLEYELHFGLDRMTFERYCFCSIRLFSSLQKLYVEEYQSAFHRYGMALSFQHHFPSLIFCYVNLYFTSWCSFPTLEIWNNMDLQGTESGPLILIHHHFQCQLPIQLMLIWSLNLPKRIQRSGLIGDLIITCC